MLNLFNWLANSILVPTPSVQETNTGSLIFKFLKSNSEPNPPMRSLLNKSFLFLTSFFDISEICFTNLLANEIFTPLLSNYFVFFSFIKMIIKFYEI